MNRMHALKWYYYNHYMADYNGQCTHTHNVPTTLYNYNVYDCWRKKKTVKSGMKLWKINTNPSCHATLYSVDGRLFSDSNVHRYRERPDQRSKGSVHRYNVRCQRSVQTEWGKNRHKPNVSAIFFFLSTIAVVYYRYIYAVYSPSPSFK